MQIYLVGGAVRDQAMGIEPKDHDYLVVGSTPEAMLAQGFEQVGADFPVFLHPTTREEYALARTERKNGVGYHGFDVNFDKSVTLREDLERRDLTINSMARVVSGDRMYDPFDGLGDIERKVLKHTSDAFRDDPLRVIRLARFAARMPLFTIHHSTMALCKRMVENGELNHLPFERFAAEIVKVLKDARPGKSAARFFEVLDELNVDQHVTFFKYMKLPRLAKVAHQVMHGFAPDDRAENFAALAYGDDAFTIHIGGTEAKVMRDLLLMNRDQGSDDSKAVRLEKLCSRISYQSPDRLFRYMHLVDAAQQLGIVFEFDRAILNTAYHLLAPVSSDVGPGLQAMGKSGKEIGQAIAEHRLRVAQILVNV